MIDNVEKVDFQIKFGKQIEKFRLDQNLSYRQLLKDAILIIVILVKLKREK